MKLCVYRMRAQLFQVRTTLQTQQGVIKNDLSIAYFYTFITVEGHVVSLTDSHFIVVVDNCTGPLRTIRASEVTPKHQLSVAGRTVSLAHITYIELIGFYSPITLSGYLTVNNLSTSVYCDMWVSEAFLFRMNIYYVLSSQLACTTWASPSHHESFPIVLPCNEMAIWEGFPSVCSDDKWRITPDV